MVLPLLMAAAGTGLSMYGASKKKHAMQGAEQAYMQRVQQLLADRQRAQQEAMQGYGQLSSEHNQQLGSAVGNWLGADQNATPDANYAPNVQATVNALRGQTAEQNPWNAQSGAAQSAIAGQTAHANTNLQTAIGAGQSSDKQRRLGLMRENALQPYTAGEMDRASKMQRLQQAFQLRNAMLGSGFALDQSRLQGDLNAAGRAGDHGIMWGTLLQQLGGMGGGYQAQPGQEDASGTDPGGGEIPGGWAGYDQPNMYTQDGGMYA